MKRYPLLFVVRQWSFSDTLATSGNYNTLFSQTNDRYRLKYVDLSLTGVLLPVVDGLFFSHYRSI